MGGRFAGPWTVSVVVHLAVVTLVLALALTWLPEPPSSVRLSLLGPVLSGTSSRPSVSSGPSLPGSPLATAVPPAENATWQSGPEFTISEEFYRALSSFDERLGDLVISGAPEVLSPPEPPVSGWSQASRTEGHALPPLPPADLLPVQGAHWNLVFTIPAEGGFPLAIEGLSQGMPDLDRWLEVWLQDVTFPVSQTNSSYQLRWNLILDVGLPE